MSFGGAIAILAVIGPVIGYLYGSILFAVIVGKLFAHKDVRKFESGNPGATNATRVLGNKLGFLVLIMDISKAVVPTLIMWFIFWFALRKPLGDTGSYFLNPRSYFNGGILIYLAGFFAVVGHLFPLYYHFHGGKGIATFGGLLLILSPFLGVAAAIIIIICVWTTRYVSLGAVMAVLIVPALILIPGIDYIYLVQPNITDYFHGTYKYWCLVDLPIMCFLYLLSAMMIYRHRGNIRAIRNGTERKFEPKNRISVFKDNKVVKD